MLTFRALKNLGDLRRSCQVLSYQYYNFATAAPKLCLYRVLNVSTDADLDEIKQSYLNLAKKYHPDVFTGEKAQEDKFKEISEAYQILADSNKRKKYDFENGIITRGKSYEKTKAEFQNEDTYSEWLGKNNAQNEMKDMNHDALNEYFQKKYFENKDYYKNKVQDDNPWDMSRKLFNQHMDRKEEMEKNYVQFNPYTFKAYYEHKDELKYSSNRHIIFKILYDFRYLIFLGFVLFNIFIVGKMFLESNQEKVKVEKSEIVKEGKGLKTKMLPLNPV